MNHTNNANVSISDESVFNGILEEKTSQKIGYYELVNQDTTPFKEFAKTVKQKNIVVIGIGGSTLGTYAIYKFLKHSKKLTKNLFFLETTDPIDIKSKLDLIDINDTLFIVISKSGTTVETVSIFKYLNSLVVCDKTNTVVITESDSKLNTYARTHGMKSFEVPKNVGGRFSVFCAVGLVPLAIVGLDIDALLAGPKMVHDSFFGKKESYETIIKKGCFLAENKDRYNINVVFTYSSRMEGFNKWYVQLWGESLGKIDKNQVSQGLTPIGITGPIDQHSFLQLIMEGKRDKTITVVKVKDFDNHVKIPNITLAGLEELDYLNGLEFSKLINMQADATIEAINDLVDVPCDVIVIDSIDEESIASLMYEYELLTSVTAKFMEINAYDQPGVESGKIILKNKLKG